jgi:hypothetical protein
MLVKRLLIMLVLTLHPATAGADGGPFGLGLIVGEPTGITGLYELGDTTAIDGAIGLDDFGFDGIYIHADFLFILPNLLSGGSVGLRPYLGPGGFLVLGGRDRGGNSGSGSSGSGGGGKGSGVGVRVPFGLSLEFRRAPLQIFAEIAPELEVVPDPDFGLGGALGFRYYF